MQDPRDSGSPNRLPLAPPSKGDEPSRASLSQASMTEVQKEDDGFGVDKQLGEGTLPCKNLVDALALPSSIGTAVAAGGLFTAIVVDAQNDEDREYQAYLVKKLAMSGFLFALATANTMCLQALYSSPSFCKILYKKLNQNPELRTEFEPWPSWDFMRYVVAYVTVAWAFGSMALHLIATMLIFQLFPYHGREYPTQLIFGLACFTCIVIWGISVVLERPPRLRGGDISQPASYVTRSRHRSSNQIRA